jgi:hypothetical protein
VFGKPTEGIVPAALLGCSDRFPGGATDERRPGGEDGRPVVLVGLRVLFAFAFSSSSFGTIFIE